jgi:trk system potassium uptake protein TrkA
MTEDLRVVIAGGGRVGFQTAEILDDRGHDVMIVERDPDVCDEIADAYIATVIRGDATRPTILEQTDLEGADVVAALTGESGTNLAVCMEAERMADGLRTVARIDDPEPDEYVRHQFVDAVVFPERAGSRVAANEIVGSDVQTLADVTGTLDIMQVRVAEGAPAAGKQLSDVRFPSGTLVVSAEDGARVSRPDTVLEPGKRYVVAVEPDVVDEVMNLLRG